MIFSCRSGAAGELDQDERGEDVLSPGPAVAWLVTVSLLVLPGGQKSFLLEGQEGSCEAILGLGECVISSWGCVCESLLFLESKVTTRTGDIQAPFLSGAGHSKHWPRSLSSYLCTDGPQGTEIGWVSLHG